MTERWTFMKGATDGVAGVLLVVISVLLLGGNLADGALNDPVSALFVFGDSTVDSGNNNRLHTIAKANFPPFGRDFDTHTATGRFCNGRLTQDYICEYLGLPLVLAYVAPEASMFMRRGVNFASAGSGILNDTGKDLGEHIPFMQQVNHFLQRHREMESTVGTIVAHEIIAKSILYISIGGNDYIHNYIVGGSQSLLSADDFNALILSNLYNRIKDLYQGGARKMVVISVGPIGCAPFVLYKYNSSNGECIASINKLVMDFNNRLQLKVEQLNEDLMGATIIYSDIYNIMLNLTHAPHAYGFEVGDTACCGVGPYGGALPCLNTSMVCDHPASYVWWDEYHPSHAANALLANAIWKGSNAHFNFSFSGIGLQVLASM